MSCCLWLGTQPGGVHTTRGHLRGLSSLFRPRGDATLRSAAQPLRVRDRISHHAAAFIVVPRVTGRIAAAAGCAVRAGLPAHPLGQRHARSHAGWDHDDGRDGRRRRRSKWRARAVAAQRVRRHGWRAAAVAAGHRGCAVRQLSRRSEPHVRTATASCHDVHASSLRGRSDAGGGARRAPDAMRVQRLPPRSRPAAAPAVGAPGFAPDATSAWVLCRRRARHGRRAWLLARVPWHHHSVRTKGQQGRADRRWPGQPGTYHREAQCQEGAAHRRRRRRWVCRLRGRRTEPAGAAGDEAGGTPWCVRTATHACMCLHTHMHKHAHVCVCVKLEEDPGMCTCSQDGCL
mmetsp:Transcript_16280/g.48487  ORF Transcript_16280/g.48487 Transcript_16280/m.48487 type:complete len:345 (-) Transcript_16280:87-1121(-)